MVTFILHHFMVDYKRVLCMAVDHGHLLLLKQLWIIWPERNALEGVLSESICPKSKQQMSVPSYSLKILHVCAGRQPPHTAVWVCVCMCSLRKSLCFYQKDIEQLWPQDALFVCVRVCVFRKDPGLNFNWQTWQSVFVSWWMGLCARPSKSDAIVWLQDKHQ